MGQGVWWHMSLSQLSWGKSRYYCEFKASIACIVTSRSTWKESISKKKKLITTHTVLTIFKNAGILEDEPCFSLNDHKEQEESRKAVQDSRMQRRILTNRLKTKSICRVMIEMAVVQSGYNLKERQNLGPHPTGAWYSRLELEPQISMFNQSTNKFISNQAEKITKQT